MTGQLDSKIVYKRGVSRKLDVLNDKDLVSKGNYIIESYMVVAINRKNHQCPQRIDINENTFYKNFKIFPFREFPPPFPTLCPEIKYTVKVNTAASQEDP